MTLTRRSLPFRRRVLPTNQRRLFALWGFWAVAWVLMMPGALIAQEEPRQGRPSQGQGTRTVTAVRVSEPLQLDGLLSEEIWGQVEPAVGFLQKDPQEGAPASERTEVRIVYDTRHIYFGITCYDSQPGGIRATELRRDQSLGNDDIFELILDQFHDHRSGYLFRINPLGTQYDATVTGEGQTINANWDEKWEVEARVTETGWSAEIAIPFKTLRFLQGDSVLWGVNFHRTIKRKNEDVFWTAHNRNYRFVEVSRAGHLLGLSEIQGFTFRVKPFFTTGASKAIERGEEKTKHLTDIGIEDAKFMITPQLALDATANPDFAQAEVDEAQVNLTRFSLFFPEKREFFQEGSGIFQFGTGEAFGRPQVLLFHSRRIGLSPSREEIPIFGGVKLTGKQGPFDMGLLNMQTDRSSGVPGQNFTVLRAKANILARSYVGAIVTRNTAGSEPASNRAGGLDASFTFWENLNFRGFVAKNGNSNVEGGEWAGQAKLEWDSDRFQFLLEHVNVGENFALPMGFVSREDIQRSRAEFSYKPRPNMDRIRQFEFKTSLDYLTDQEGVLQTRTANFQLSADV